MNSCIAFHLLVLTVAGVSLAQEQAGEMPQYRRLYEQGYYREAIGLLKEREEQQGFADASMLQYRAFCEILLGNHAVAESLFCVLLDRDTLFSLDPVLTSPRLFEVYAHARLTWNARRREAGPPEGYAVAPPDSVAKGPTAGAEHAAQGMRPSGHAVLPVALRLLPAGVGQVLNQRPLWGVVSGALQLGALGTSVALYRYRSSLYDDQWGIHDGNRERYLRVTRGYRGGLYLAVSAFAASVVQAQVDYRQNRIRVSGKGEKR